MSGSEALEISRPQPPKDVIEQYLTPQFVPAPDLGLWCFETFIEPGGLVFNEDHVHLRVADIGFLWTNVPNFKHGRRIIGQAEVPRPPTSGGIWAKERWELQMNRYFGRIPDFIITIDATAVIDMTDIPFCALMEHELYHCGQARDGFGTPQFTKAGRPKYAMRGHDVEEFVGVARRYGAVSPGVFDMVKAVAEGPEVAEVNIQQACGTCAAKAA